MGREEYCHHHHHHNNSHCQLHNHDIHQVWAVKTDIIIIVTATTFPGHHCNHHVHQVWAGRTEEREYLRKVSSHRELELEWSMLCQVRQDFNFEVLFVVCCFFKNENENLLERITRIILPVTLKLLTICRSAPSAGTAQVGIGRHYTRQYTVSRTQRFEFR